MNKFLEFLMKCLPFLFTVKQTSIPKPTPKPVGGIFSMNVKCKDVVNKAFSNSILMGALRGRVDLQKEFNLGFACEVNLNTNQKYSYTLVDGGIRIDFDETHPQLKAEKFFDVESDIEYVFVDQNHAVISLVGLPDYKINFV